jgi:PPOX class probable F420-dependent enzyme
VRLTQDEARRRFGTVPAVRLATADGQGRPHLVVMTFAVQGDMVFSAVDQKPKSGRALKRLRNVEENPQVALLADEYAEDWDTLWWARADGQAVVLTEPREMAEPLGLLVSRYSQYRAAPPAGPVLAVTVQRWSGWAAIPG